MDNPERNNKPVKGKDAANILAIIAGFMIAALPVGIWIIKTRV